MRDIGLYIDTIATASVGEYFTGLWKYKLCLFDSIQVSELLLGSFICSVFVTWKSDALSF